ncbi:MAG: flagellar protein FliS [Lachnospiraceae bacterium]
MKKEQKQEFTARIVNANRSALIVVQYDMIFAYMEDARRDYEEGHWEEVKMDLTRIESIVRHLEDILDHSYEISGQLYRLYRFCQNQLALCRVKKNLDGMENCRKILDNLYIGIQGMEKADTSEPLMKNSQTVVAGITYGKTSMNEVYMDDEKRGFFA